MKGIIGRKVGMTQIFEQDGTIVPVTIIEAGPCFVVQRKTVEKDGYAAIQLGFDEVRPKDLSQPEKGHLGLLKTDQKHPTRRKLAEAVPPLRVLREIRLSNVEDYQEGQKITVAIFAPGEWVDVTGTSKGKGFQGGVRRHGFKGGPRTHGQSDRTRAPGASGATTSPGRVLKGMRMAGHMGNKRVTASHLRVVLVDPERNLLAVRGAVPGHRNSLVIVREARKQVK
jgi:large subunit ribosomal protein L3